LLLTLQGEDGHAGIGEASPLPGYSPDDLSAVAASLDTFLASLSSVPETPEGIEERCAALVFPAARFAAESALLDLLARVRGCPLHELFRPATGAIERSGLLQSSTPEGLLQEAREKRSQGLSCLKIKIGALPIEEEIARLRALQRGLTPRPPLLYGEGEESLTPPAPSPVRRGGGEGTIPHVHRTW
jgi:L-alanine-DL-glutamate epimerase-like enolase superfamily enzyme